MKPGQWMQIAIVSMVGVAGGAIANDIGGAPATPDRPAATTDNGTNRSESNPSGNHSSSRSSPSGNPDLDAMAGANGHAAATDVNPGAAQDGNTRSTAKGDVVHGKTQGHPMTSPPSTQPNAAMSHRNKTP